MQITRLKIQYLPTTILIIVGVLVLVLSCPDVTPAFDFHLDSAHGNPAYGVNRTDLECPPGTPCPQGDCAHCHETFDPSTCGVNNFLLWYDDYVSQGELFCYGCHSSVPIVEQPVTNYPYCVTFGGRAAFYVNIRNQFYNANSGPGRCGSRHLLSSIRYVIEDNAYDWGFNSDPDPCVACHSPHAAQRNHPVAIDGEGKLNTAIRRPSHYKSTDPQDFLWGDDADERMSTYASSVGGTYKAPYYGSPGDRDTGPFEPANDSTSDGSNLPDYVTFCMDCHQYAQYDPERSAVVDAIVWDYSHGPKPDRHGAAPSNTCYGGTWEGTLKPPYDTYEPNESNFVLSCLDCHEPHATHTRLHLIRRMINGGAVAGDASPCDEAGDFAQICEKCHDWGDHAGACNNPECHGDPADWPVTPSKMHGGTLAMPAGPARECHEQPMF